MVTICCGCFTNGIGNLTKDFIWIYEYYNNTLLLEQIRNKELILSQMEREKEAKLREVELKLMLNKSHEVIAEAQSDIQGLLSGLGPTKGSP